MVADTYDKPNKKDGRLFTYGMTLFVLFIVLSIGAYVMWTMKDAIENHPEITEIGAPPRLEYMVVTVLVLAGAISLILKFGNYENEDDELFEVEKP